jgi:hypothetical protein
MKLKLLLVVISSFIIVSMFHKSGVAEQAIPVNEIAVADSMKSMTSTIDGIAVPVESLMQIQMKYQGYAVTKAQQVNRNGKEVYELRVDRDDQTTDYDGFYLFYDKNWKFLDEQKITAPQKSKPQIAPSAKPEPAPAPEDEGGRGGSQNPQPEERNTGNQPTAPAPSNTSTNPNDKDHEKPNRGSDRRGRD